MNGRTRPAFLTACLLVLLVVRCGSQSVLEARFTDSRSLQTGAPRINVQRPDRFTFAAVGDLHVGTGTERFRRILGAARDEGDEFIVLLGDITDKGEADSLALVTKAIDDYGYTGKVLPLVGNHDIFKDTWKNYRDVFGPSHYSTVIGNTRFIALDTGDGNVGEAQSDWLAAELSAGGMTNTFVLSHYALVVPGVQTYLKLANEMEATRLMKLAMRHRVTAWLSAHYHSYVLGNIEGVDYLVAGGGGGRRMGKERRFFFVQVRVDGASHTFTLRPVE